MLFYSEKAGWSKRNKFRTPPAAGDSEVKFIMLSDMGKNERDSSNEHYLQVRINISAPEQNLQRDVPLHNIPRYLMYMQHIRSMTAGRGFGRD